jgi:3-hydroxymyristoyl/3-hydroxydecanoyl-(acyl carrier protein) dehydratase
VRPGETLRLEVKVVDKRRGMWTCAGKATVDGQRVAEGSFLATLAPVS